MEREYFNIVEQELLNRKEALRLNCNGCRRKCGHTPEEIVECLANLMTIEYLLDHCQAPD